MDGVGLVLRLLEIGGEVRIWQWELVFLWCVFCGGCERWNGGSWGCGEEGRRGWYVSRYGGPGGSWKRRYEG